MSVEKKKCHRCNRMVNVDGKGRFVTHGPSTDGRMTCPGSWGPPPTADTLEGAK